MEGKNQLQTETMEIIELELPAKVADVSKYNLRCNRSISEKMTKKDFIYDIRRPLQGTRKYEQQRQRLPIMFPTRIRKQKSDPKISKYSFIPISTEMVGGGDMTILPVPRALNYECNFCHQPIATLSSLSTHVKFHLRRYCKKCYWILEDGETMEIHTEKAHPTASGR